MANWEEQAACAGMDLGYFIVKDGPGRPSFPDLIKLLDGQRICKTCPVRKECHEDASWEDKRVSIRGGRWPNGLRHPHRDFYSPERFPNRLCNGQTATHNLAETGIDTQGRCIACKQERYRRNNLNQRAKEKAARIEG